MNESRKQIARRLLSEIAPAPITRYKYSTKTGKTVTKGPAYKPDLQCIGCGDTAADVPGAKSEESKALSDYTTKEMYKAGESLMTPQGYKKAVCPGCAAKYFEKTVNPWFKKKYGKDL
mgnify:CR=1 FL=1